MFRPEQNGLGRTFFCPEKEGACLRIGIPRALYYYRYGALWKTFFSSLGCEVVVSPKTDRAILQSGIQIHDRSKTEIALCNIDGSELTCEVVYVLKEVFMDCLQCRKLAGRKII